MSNNFKNSAFAKNLRENKSVWITAITLLVALAVIAAVAAVANRAKVGGEDTTTEPPETTQPPETQTPDVPEDPGASDVGKILPVFSLPVSGKLQKGHDAELQTFSATMNDYRVHLGLDIATELSAPVLAAADGTVIEVWEDALMGRCIAVQHSGDAVTVYKNLAAESPEGIEAGAKVTAGQTIAYVGESAMTEIADEPHLHFEMTVGGLQVDPLEYFGESAVALLGEDSSFEKPAEE